MKIMILVTTTPQIDGYRIVATKGRVQGNTFEEMLHHADQLGANAIVKADYDKARSGESAFHGTAAVVEPIQTRSDTLTTTLSPSRGP